MGDVRKRLLQEEKGFTLTEVMVTMVIMIIVLFALYNLFDMGLRVFSFGNSEVEATENARLGLEKMDREIQAAYAYDRGATTPDTHLFDTRTATQIRFGNDLDGNRKIECPVAAPPACEQIAYRVYETPAGSGSYALGRDNSSANNSPQPVVEYVDYVSATDTGLAFTYLKADGVTAAASESEIAVVRIALRIRVKNGFGDGTQTLTTDVALRNRGEG